LNCEASGIAHLLASPRSLGSCMFSMSRPRKAAVLRAPQSRTIAVASQQTQKSFSIIASAKPVRAAVSAKTCARSSPDMRAILFKRLSPRSFSLLHRSSPRRNACLSQACASPPVTAPHGAFQSLLRRHPLCQDAAALAPQARICLRVMVATFKLAEAAYGRRCPMVRRC